MAVMNVWLIGRNGKILNYSETESFVISPDYLTNRQSQFVLQQNIGVQSNQYLIAKDNSGKVPAFFGVVSSLENSTINANNIIQLLNFEIIIEKSISGPSLEKKLMDLIFTNFMMDDTKATMPISNIVKTNTPFYLMLDEQAEKYTKYNLAELMILAFEKYGVVWQFDDITFSGGGNIYTMHTSMTSYPDQIKNIKDNLYSIVNWDVYDRPIGPTLENKAIVYDTSSGLDFSKADIFYLKSDNTLTQDPNDNVYRPTKNKVVLYDKTNEESTPQELAASALLGNTYSHEINFDLKPSNEMIDLSELKIGQKFDIIYQDSLYQSILTGYTKKSDSNYVGLKFGNYRSDFNQVMKNYSRRN